MRGEHKLREARKVSGNERKSEGPREGQVVVVASHTTEEGREVRPKRPTGGKATSSKASTGYDTRERLRAHHSCQQPPSGLHHGQQRLCLRNRMRELRTYGSVGGPDG